MFIKAILWNDVFSAKLACFSCSDEHCACTADELPPDCVLRITQATIIFFSPE
jgi:hypothetical protein